MKDLTGQTVSVEIKQTGPWALQGSLVSTGASLA